MSKGILKFNLPEEREEFEHAQKGVDYLMVIENLDNYLRAKLKYTELSEVEEKIYTEIRNKLNELKYD